MNHLSTLAPLFAAFLLAGCPTETDTGGKDTDTGAADTDTGSETGDTTDTTDTTDSAADTYNVSGVAIDFPGMTPVAEGLCVVAVDPTPAMMGGDPTILMSTTTGANGAYTLTAIAEKPAVGLVIIVEDCGGEGTVYPTGTGVKADVINALGSGETLGDQTSFSLSPTTVIGVQQSFQALGGAWDSMSEGLLMGFVFDSAGNPINGATVAGVGATTYYVDGTTADGMFGAGTTANMSTDATTGAVWAIPAAPVTAYLATADGYTFDAITGGSLPGLALFVAFFAN